MAFKPSVFCSDYYCLDSYHTYPKTKFVEDYPGDVTIEEIGRREAGDARRKSLDPDACSVWFNILIQEMWTSINMIDFYNPCQYKFHYLPNFLLKKVMLWLRGYAKPLIVQYWVWDKLWLVLFVRVDHGAKGNYWGWSDHWRKLKMIEENLRKKDDAIVNRLFRPILWSRPGN